MKKQIRALALAVLFALSLLPAAGSGNVIVEILADIDLTGKDWNPVTVSATFKLAQ